jgi:enamine deaminase RidA (YjgF/YER057c/UK114 family)
LTDEAYVKPWGNVRSRYVAENSRPAGALLIISGLARKGLIVEIEAIAAVG